MIGAGKIITDGLVYSVDASDRNSYPGSGTSWNDLVHENHGTLTNGPTLVSDGTSGNYINLDGTNDYIEVGNVAEIKQAINQTFSISFWTRPVYNAGYRCVFGFMNGDNTAGGGVEFVNNTRKFKFWVADDSNFEGPECTSDATDNVWCQIVSTSDGSTLRWNNIYTTDMQLSNMDKEVGNEVDGTKGDWTIQEGRDDLFLINRLNGKKYKFKLEEVKDE